jgi:hypothetical protein
MTPTLDELETRIAALENRPSPDALQPNVLQVLPNGKIAALLTGGLELLEIPPNNPLGPAAAIGSSITWLDGLTVVREQIQAYETFLGQNHILSMLSIADAEDTAGILASTELAGGAGISTVTATAVDSTLSSAQALLIDSSKRSSFAQLPVPARTVFAPFQVAGVWPGAAPDVVIAFAHGLNTAGVNHISYLATYNDTGGGFAGYAGVIGPTAAGCTLVAADPFGSPGAGNTFTIDVLVILQY